MDFTPIETALKVAGAIATLLGLPKLLSDLRLNKVSQKRQIADLLKEITAWPIDDPAFHPIVLQAKFQAALGCSPRRIPPASEILAFLKDTGVATFSNLLEYAYTLEFVAYSIDLKTLVPRDTWTRKKIRRASRTAFWSYLVTASFTVALIGTPHFQFGRLLLIIPLGFLAVHFAVRGKHLSRARTLLKRLKKATCKMACPLKAA